MSFSHRPLPSPDTQSYRLLELVAVSGEFPADQLRRLPGGESYKANVVKVLKRDKLLRTHYQDGLRGYRLTARAKALLLQDNRERFTFYLTGRAETNVLKSEVVRRLRLHRIAEVWVTMNNAGIAIYQDEKPDVFYPQGSGPGPPSTLQTPAFYSSREIKELDTEAVKIHGARMVGALLSPDSVYAVYNTGGAAMKWSYKSELRSKVLLKTVLCQQRLADQYHMADVRGLIFGDGMEMARQLMAGKGEARRGYVDAFAKAEGVRLRVSRRVNGFWGEVYRIGASYPVEYEEDDGVFVECGLSDKQYESDRLRLQIMQEAAPNALTAFENSAELNRAWCARCEELLLQDIVTVGMDQLDKTGNKRIFPEIDVNAEAGCFPGDEERVREYIAQLKHSGFHLRLPAKQALGRGRYCTPSLERAVGERVIRSISDLKRLQPYHLRLPAIQAVTKGRYCTSVGKEKVFNRTAISLMGDSDVKLLVVSGERRGESKNRAAYNEIELHPTNATKRGHRLVHWWRPVIDHSERDVWERIRRHQCMPHPVYTCGWNRCSCMLCIFSKREQWAGIRELFPAEFERLANDEKILGYTMHIGMPLEEYVGDAKSCVCHDDPLALRQLVEGFFSPDDIYTDDWTFPNGAFRGSEGGPC